MTKPQFDIPCVILCGGRSSRMGEDKALLPFSNYNTLAHYQFDRLKSHFKNIYLSSKTNKFDFLKSDENIIFDNIEDESSPLIALKSIFETIKSDKVFVMTVDTPFIKIETIEKLINESLNSSTIAITSREHNLCGVYEKSCLNVINEMLKENNHKIGFLLKKIELKKIEFFDENEFLNLNKKEDYQKALSLI